MSTDKQIVQKLAVLGKDAVFEKGAMVLGPAGDADMLSTVLQAIDNTVLARNLTFSVADASVTLCVGGRRLKSVVASAGAVGADEAVFGKLLSNEDGEQLGQLKSVLETLVVMDGTLTMASGPATGPGGQTDTGVSLASLADLWKVDPYGAPLSRLDRILRALDSKLVGLIDLSDEASNQGTPEVIDALRAAYDGTVGRLVEDHAALRAEPDADFCITLQGLMAEDSLICFFRVDNQAVLAATVSGSWSEISSSWSMG